MSSRKATVTDNPSEPKAKAAKVTEEADTCSDGFGVDLPDEACSFVELPSEPPQPVTQPPDEEECANCVKLNKERRILRNRVLTLEANQNKKNAENRKLRRIGK